MKKVFAFVLSFIIITAAFMPVLNAQVSAEETAPFAALPEPGSGDVDGDGVTAPADARLALRCAVNLEQLSESAFKAADMDGDGEITPADARTILRIAVGLPADEKEPENEFEKAVNDTMKKMSLREKVGQLFVVMPEVLSPEIVNKRVSKTGIANVYSVSESMKETYEKYPVGGFILFGGNISSGSQLKNFTSQLHALGSIRPFVYIDEEGGTVARIGNSGCINVQKYGNMQSIAETRDPANAYALGEGIGSYLNEYGIDLDFAPVADVNTNPYNPVIGRRAFGSEPVLAGKMVSAVISGLHSQGVGSCIKHFPGHGDTKTDTHKAYAETLKTWNEIKNCEMIPFEAGIKAGTDMVMAAHISAPKVTGDGTPATLSYTLITEKLRGELGYDGVVITDSMSMLAVADRYTPAEAAVKAIKAGVDIVLIPDCCAEAFNGIINAVNSGEISVDRINESVRRVLTMKMK